MGKIITNSSALQTPPDLAVFLLITNEHEYIKSFYAILQNNSGNRL